MKPTRIFLDLDDVLNCFTIGALKYVGCPVNPHDYSVFNPAWGWDIVAAANALHPTRQFTTSSFWESIKRDFWATAPMSSECLPLLLACEELVGPERICILSSPTLDPDCLAGKLEWIHAFLPRRMHRQFLIGPQKHMCARPDALLIDDRWRNVADFRLHGGQAILMPRPWNPLCRIENPLRCVAAGIDRLFQERTCT